MALEDHILLGHIVPRHVQQSLRVRDGTPPLVGEVGRIRGGHVCDHAQSLEGSGLLPSQPRPGLVPDEGTPATWGVVSACVDLADSVLPDGDMLVRSNHGAEDVRAGASPVFAINGLFQRRIHCSKKALYLLQHTTTTRVSFSAISTATVLEP